MDLSSTTLGMGRKSLAQRIRHVLWPLDEIDPKNSKFPCCLVWCPLPVVSWLTPFFGHVGICREDGVILDFSGSYLINVDDFAFGAVARYYQLDRTKCCFPPHLAGHTCNCRYQHADYGPAITWDDALYSSQCHFEHHTYNIFTCNCYSFVANCLNRLCYGGSMEWNMVSVAALVLTKGHWVDGFSVLRSFLPCITVLCLGLAMTGWHFLIALLSFSFLVFGWFVFVPMLVMSYAGGTMVEFKAGDPSSDANEGSYEPLARLDSPEAVKSTDLVDRKLSPYIVCIRGADQANIVVLPKVVEACPPGRELQGCEDDNLVTEKTGGNLGHPKAKQARPPPSRSASLILFLTPATVFSPRLRATWPLAGAVFLVHKLR
nr:protein REVERSION-TO-ETHYLENE SENSITIVITY1 [Ipomoea batatas]